ncbi:MAG: HlyD family efflux transporter periplasmic adaptor subunit [Acidobacteria bacterium]|nr:MAG: HlyD family efflux transporter periplasmic adaptor subunit [Acidobacteriota bacterium]REK00303.1 MAG: HlyD family efflux transporter periplasmic adaptor subunit [Acidobacteriota bacterium]
MILPRHPRLRRPVDTGLALVATVALLLSACAGDGTDRADREVTYRGGSQQPAAVGGLGRLEPGDGVVDLVSPTGEAVHSLSVGEGDSVQAGQILATLVGSAERQAELAVAEQQLAQARTAAQRAERLGPLEVEAQAAEVRRLEAEVAQAERDLERARSLLAGEISPQQEVERAERQRDTLAEAAASARAILERERERLARDRAEAQAAVDAAAAQRDAAEARWQRSLVRSPIDGTVLEVLAYPSELPTGPILRLGETQSMMAACEVWESDARRIRLGQRALISSPALPADLHGSVVRIGRLVQPNAILDLDPAAVRDARVLEVRIALDPDDHEVAARFVHLQVDVEIEIEGDAGGRRDVDGDAPSAPDASADQAAARRPTGG